MRTINHNSNTNFVRETVCDLTISISPTCMFSFISNYYYSTMAPQDAVQYFLQPTNLPVWSVLPPVSTTTTQMAPSVSMSSEGLNIHSPCEETDIGRRRFLQVIFHNQAIPGTTRRYHEFVLSVILLIATAMKGVSCNLLYEQK
jgi:hypothetical protein